MKKILVILSIAIFSLVSVQIVNATAFNYAPVFSDNIKWTLDEGELENDPAWSATFQIFRGSDTVQLSTGALDLFHHALYWDKNNHYIGYTNDQSTYQGPRYLGDYYDEMTGILSFPAGATRFALVIFKGTESYDTAGILSDTWGTVMHSPDAYSYNTFPLADSLYNIFTTPDYENYTNDAPLGGNTLYEIFDTPGPSYTAYTDSVLTSQASVWESADQGGSDLSYSFDKLLTGNLFKNPYFERKQTNLGFGSVAEWSPRDEQLTSITWVDNSGDSYMKVDDHGNYGMVDLTPHASIVSGHVYYIQADLAITSSAATTLTFATGGSAILLTFTGLTSSFSTKYGLITPNHSGNRLSFYQNTNPDNLSYSVDNCFMFDLTAEFGAGDEPTAAWVYSLLSTTNENPFPQYFGDTFYNLENIADTDNMSYSDLLTLVGSYNVPTYTLTRVLPVNLVSNSTMSGSTSPWVGLNGNLTLSSGRLSSARSVPMGGSSFYGAYQNVSFTSGMQYYFSVGSFQQTVQGVTNYPRVSTRTATAIALVDLIAEMPDDLADNHYSSIMTATANAATLACYSYSPNIGDVLYLDNIYSYNVSTMKSGGLFSGLSDAQIKTILDDYTANGLTSSNIGYFFTGPAEWESLSYATRCNLLWKNYGKNYTGGTVIDVFSDYFTDNFYYKYAMTTNGGSWDFHKCIEKVSRSYGLQDFYRYTDEQIEAMLDDWTLLDYDGHADFEDTAFIDYTRYPLNWNYSYPIDETDYYTGLFWDAVNEVPRWEFYKEYGITSLNYAYYTALYADAIAEVDRWEWYEAGGITSSNWSYYAALYADAVSLETFISINYYPPGDESWVRWEFYAPYGATATNWPALLLEWNHIYDHYLITLYYADFSGITMTGDSGPETPPITPIGDRIDDFFTDYDVGPGAKIAIAIGVMVVIGICLAMFKAPFVVILLAEILAYILFLLLDFFPAWTAIIVALGFVLALYFILKR